LKDGDFYLVNFEEKKKTEESKLEKEASKK